MNPVKHGPKTYYLRKENNGILTIAPRQGLYQQQVYFFNATAAVIFEMCDGKKSPEQIAGKLHKKYPQEDLNNLKADVKETLYSLKELEVIKWTPDSKKEKETTNMDAKKDTFGAVTIQAIGDENISDLSKFIQNSAKDYAADNQNNICFLQVPFNIDQLYAPFSIRIRHFHFMEVFYIMIKDEKIIGVISLSNLNPARKAVEISVTIGKLHGGSGETMRNLMDYIVKEMKNLGIIKIKYLIPNSETDANFPKLADETFKKFISDNKFSLEAVLTDEINAGIDLIIWSRRI